MKALRIHEFGGPETLRWEEIPEPEPGPGETVLDVKAASINHLDIWTRKGLPGVKLPRILGCDAAGIADGKRVLLNPGFSCGSCEFCSGGDMSMCLDYGIWGEHRDGTHVERLAVPRSSLIPIPDHLSFEEAAAMPLVTVTAWRMLFTRGRLAPAEDVLVWSAGAGVGTVCVQLAKLAGARVFATASTAEKCERLKRLGADEVINHGCEDVVKRVKERTGRRGVDLVVDYVGKETWARSLAAVRRGGRIATCGATSGHDPLEDLRHIFYRQLEVVGCTMGNNRELMSGLKLLFEGKIRPVIDGVVPMRDAAEAHRRIEARKAFGKVVLVPS
ncbi:MAG: zinc-binding dehydrogenase [Planctomycetes bacterium]|nr:zinc-binding dehydrogenase [Planctomycetota bacterium]